MRYFAVHAAIVGSKGKEDSHEWEVTRGGDLDFEPHRSGLLLGFDQDVVTRRGPFRFLRIRNGFRSLQKADQRVHAQCAVIEPTGRAPKMSSC